MSEQRIVAAARLVVDDEVFEPGWIRVVDGSVAEVGAGSEASGPGGFGAGSEASGPGGFGAGSEASGPVEHVAGTIVPGFVDLHCHGGGGYEFTDPDLDRVGAALDFHRAAGNAATMVSLVTAAADDLLAQVRRLAPLVAAGAAAGIHLEGPWLAVSRCGAQDPRFMRAPDGAEIGHLLEAGQGTITMVTLAPELPGALAAIDQLVAADVAVAIGHTDADYDTTRAAIDRGATVATHLFNGMRPFGHRDPGPILALLDDERVTVEVIGDGVHVDERVVHSLARSLRPGRLALVTDAMAAAGMPDGQYRLGSLEVNVADGVARLRDADTIAGGTSTMAEVFERFLRNSSSDGGPSSAGPDALRAAVAMTSSTPARVLGRADLGSLRPGSSAVFAVV